MSIALPISSARSQLPSLVDRVSRALDRVLITVSGKPKAVIMSLEELESIEETAEILSIPGAYKAIMKGYKQAKKGQTVPLEVVLKKYSK